MSGGHEFTAPELLTMREYPRSDRRQAFYGQSIFLARLLIARKDHQQFVKFLERSAMVGSDAALQECYAIAGAVELERLWRREFYIGRTAAH
jgi:hypothetical protein